MMKTNQKKKILYISSTASGMHSSSIYFDLMHSLLEAENEVYCAYALEKRFDEESKFYLQDDIHYLGIKIGNISKNKNLVSKGIATLTIDGLYLKAIKKHLSHIKFDMVLYSTPPITFVKTIQYFKEKNTFTYLMLKDIFPQNAFDLGLMRPNGFIAKLFKNKEKKVYQLSDYIGVMSPANLEFITRHHPDTVNKVEVLANSIKVRPDNQISTRNKESFGLAQDKMLMLYGGNLGKPQGIDFIKKCILKLEQISGVQLAICGGGAETDNLIDFMNEHKITNTIYLGSLPVEEYQDLTSICDVGLIFLDYRFTIPNFPQRLLSYMDASKPVLCATDPNTDIGEIAKNNLFGFSVLSKNAKDWTDKVEALRDDKVMRNKMGSNARNFLIKNYEVGIAKETILNHLEKREKHV